MEVTVVLVLLQIPNLKRPTVFLFLAVLIQIGLYRYFLSKIRQRFSLHQKVLIQLISTFFILINFPWLGIFLWWIGVLDKILNIPTLIDKIGSYWVYPFAIWQCSSIGLIGICFSLHLMKRLRKFLLTSLPAHFLRKIFSIYKKVNSKVDIGTKIHRREFVQAASLALMTSPFILSAYGAYVARAGYKVEKISIKYPDLPKELQGLTLVQLTDIHAGIFMNYSRMLEYVEVANGLNPDLIVLTGDFIDISSSYVQVFLDAFKNLQARYGVYAILGNHDLFSNSVTALEEGFRKNNIRLLINEQEQIKIRGAILNLMGITYIPQSRKGSSFDYAVETAMKNLEVKDTTILLSHQPNVFPKIATQNIPLTLSGHTHGGQVKFEFLGENIAPSRLMSNFISGLYSIDNSQLYVSRGVGTTGPPIRLGAIPEITHITLV